MVELQLKGFASVSEVSALPPITKVALIFFEVPIGEDGIFHRDEVL